MQERPREARGRRWTRLAPLVLTMALEASEISLLSVMFPAMERSLGLAVADLGVVAAATRLTGALFGPVWIWLAGQWSRKAVLVATAALSGVVTIGMGQAQGFAWLLLFSCVLAAVCTGTAPLTTTILGDLFEDRSRGWAVGSMYASIAAITGILGTLLGQLAGLPEGWRWAYLVLGGLGVCAAVLTAVWFHDPGVGAAEEGGMAPAPGAPRAGLRAGMGVFRVPSFCIMLVSRMLSGHLVIGSFGILFLTGVRGFPNGTAALVLLPFGIGACLGNLTGALVADWLHARAPDTGRVVFLQAAQFAFAAVAYVATQVSWDGILPYLLLWMALGLLQGVNPGVNRPIVIAVVRPELRSWAFMVMLAIVEPVGWAGFNFAVSRFGEGEGLRVAFLAVLVGMMVLNGIAVTPLYWTYRRDAARARAGPVSTMGG